MRRKVVETLPAAHVSSTGSTRDWKAAILTVCELLVTEFGCRSRRNKLTRPPALYWLEAAWLDTLLMKNV